MVQVYGSTLLDPKLVLLAVRAWPC